MSITDELREYALGWDERNRVRCDLTAIADRIDAVHANLERENESLRRELDRVLGEQEDRYREGYRKGIMDGCAYYDAEHTECLLSEPHGWVELPKDVDGVPIRVGDKVTEHEDGHTFKVDGFMDWDGEWWVFMRDGIQAPASRCTHYHAPTVEDVLRGFALEVCGEPALTIRSGVVEEYASRLRLAGEN